MQGAVPPFFISEHDLLMEQKLLPSAKKWHTSLSVFLFWTGHASS
uniref:Uncharacterized protein n=1 Tax=Nelumbo nucifera TaxID=4432 RepID=A0A822ZRF2_NELNU|nr:TPA_asm: hypothetical protein HUJ06_018461 [Nelumbo nucifera]